MSVRVRFAPSPTGLLHIGGARTAMYCYLIAKAQGGQFVLRIEDTDLERSKKEYEEKMIDDLKWLGIVYDEGPEKGGKFGPYRQSERLDLYKDLAWKLVKEGKAYPCFLTKEELDALTEKAIAEKNAPHTYHGQYRDLAPEEAQKRIDAGDEFVIRFKNHQKTYTFNDLVRGEVTFGPDMVGDFVILRSTGMPVYNFCCVIDDWKMEMTHVIRAEEHLPNTLRQLMIYEALGAEPPIFCHVSLLIGHDRQKLSKRHGATSVTQYRDQHYLPQALNNYLCLLGWSHPEERDIFQLEDIIPVFDLNRFNKSAALYDIQKLNFFNQQHLKLKSGPELVTHILEVLPKDHPFRAFDSAKQEKVALFFVEKVQLVTEFEQQLDVLFKAQLESNEEVAEVESWETTGLIRDYIKSQVEVLMADGVQNASSDTFNEWLGYIKKEMKIKGKPLFKGLRVVLTTQAEGPDLKEIIPLTPMAILKDRLGI